MRGGRVVLAAAVLAWLVALIAWIGNDPSLNSQFDAFSTYSTSPGGVSQAYAYLRARRGGTNVRRLVRTVGAEQPSHDATIFRIGPVSLPEVPIVRLGSESGKKKKDAKDDAPIQKFSDDLLSAEEDVWVRAGGRLVIAIAGRYAGLTTQTARCVPLRTVFPVDPPLHAFESPHCRSLAGAGLRRFHSLVIDDDGPVLARRPLGAGEVIVFSMPEVFSNEYLGLGGNLALLDRLAGNGRAVYFDEMTHGFTQQGTLLDLLAGDWRLGPAMLLLLAAALASFWRRATPSGPPERPERDLRSDAVDLVQSLGQLYDRSVDREEALRLYYQGLVRAIHARTGLTGEPLDRVVRARTQGYDPRPRYKDISREEFQRLLGILNHAYETVGYANTR
jgi:hypothetical protein